MVLMFTDELLQAKFAALKALLDERLRRIWAWAAVEARAIGRDGITQVARATALSCITVHTGGMGDLGAGCRRP